MRVRKLGRSVSPGTRRIRGMLVAMSKFVCCGGGGPISTT